MARAGLSRGQKTTAENQIITKDYLEHRMSTRAHKRTGVLCLCVALAYGMHCASLGEWCIMHAVCQ